MFEVGKKYRYTGNGGTRFNSDGFMDYTKTGVHVVAGVGEIALSGRPRVKFADDPEELFWALDPNDFEEVVERFFEVGKRYRYTGKGRDISVSRETLRKMCVVEEVKTVKPASEYVKFKELPCFFFVDPRNFERIPEKKVFSVYQYMECECVGETHVRKVEWPLVCDGKTAQEMSPFCTDKDWMVAESEFVPYTYETLFVGFINGEGRNAILVVPRPYNDGGHGYGLVSFFEGTDRPNWYWGGDVYETLEKAIAVLPSKGCKPVYFDSLKELMGWVVKGM